MDEMNRSQSMQGEVTRTSEFNTLIDKPQSRDHLGALTVDARMIVNLIFDCLG
jgi:hypothetical protein